MSLATRERWLLVVLLAAGCATAATAAPERRSTIRVISAETCGALEWPVDAVISSGFGWRDARPHQGIDLAAPEGTPVHAACDGVVAYAGDKLRGYGRLVILEHQGGLATVYAHNEALLVAEGERVGRGQVIARSGQTGHVTAAHVHFEVRRGGQPVDPLSLMAPRAPTAQGPRARRSPR